MHPTFNSFQCAPSTARHDRGRRRLHHVIACTGSVPWTNPGNTSRLSSQPPVRFGDHYAIQNNLYPRSYIYARGSVGSGILAWEITTGLTQWHSTVHLFLYSESFLCNITQSVQLLSSWIKALNVSVEVLILALSAQQPFVSAQQHFMKIKVHMYS